VKLSIDKAYCQYIIASEFTKWQIFTALHVMQTRYSEEISVCPSVRPSVRHTHDP